MGFLKKITRPISRVLDKIVPNEIKPALPFLAAAAPFMAPGIMGLGGNTMLSRALISGGLNLGGQLAQEGSEGDFNALSLALASGIGALSAPGAGDTLRGIGKTPGATGADAGFYVGKGMNVPESSTSFLGKAADFAGAGADKLEGIIAAGQADPFSMAGVKAASIPLTQGAMDLGFAEARRAANDVVDDALAGIGEGASDADRALAIRNAMEAYGYFSEDEILSTIESAGYRAGGRVGFDNGGSLTPTQQKMLDAGIGMFKGTEEIMESGGDPNFLGIKGAVESVDKNMRADRAGDFFRLRDEAIQKGDSDKIKEIESDFFREFGMVMPKMAKDGGRIGFRDGSSTGSFGADRYASELIEAYNSMLNKGDVLLTDAEKIIAAGEYPSAEQFKNIDDRYEQLQKGFEKEENKFTNDELEDSMLDKDALKYYIKKEKELEDREAKLEEKDLELGSKLKETDISGILRTPEFQEWYGLWSKKDPKADDLPSAEYFERLMFDVKRPEYMKKKYDIEMKEGGLMNLGGKEMDMRGGGFIPIGKKERADDVPARLSKNEFVMTADAVRAAGGGSVNEGAKRMYDVMNKLEARA